MTNLPQVVRSEAHDDVLVRKCADDDLSRAVAIFVKSRDEATQAHRACARWAARPFSSWRRPERDAALRKRMVARIKTRVSRQFLTEALRDWRPAGEGN